MRPHFSQSREDSTRSLLGQWNLEEATDGQTSRDPVDGATSDSGTGTLDTPAPSNCPTGDWNGSDLASLNFRFGGEEPDATSQPLDSFILAPACGPGAQSAIATRPLVGSKAYDPSLKVSLIPKPGEVFFGFLIVSELGRGAFARVYLAEQIDLGGRLVALKVGRAEGNEPQILARLQHTHIMPIHSVVDEAKSGLRLMCMPYVGGVNLAQLLDAAGVRNAHRTGGRSLVEALDAVSQPYHSVSRVGSSAAGDERFMPATKRSRHRRSWVDSPKPVPVAWASRFADPKDDSSNAGAIEGGGSLSVFRSLWGRIVWGRKAGEAPRKVLDERDFDQPARQFLRVANTEQAAMWVVARLAEGLEHAHSRGILHRDLKPSNILIANDGTPMLLDFNLSNDTRAGETKAGEKAMLGGTLPYMAPEHLDAFNSKGNTSLKRVDERSDIYSLGLILYEMVAGEHAFTEPATGMPLVEVIASLSRQRETVPSLKEIRPNVDWALDSIVRKCLDPDPSKRYARARDLAEDLTCHLDDQPLKHAPERSFRERAAKWARRNPRFCTATSIASTAAVSIVALGGLIGLLAYNTQSLASRLKLQVFRSESTECQFLLNLNSGPAEHLSRGIALAEKVLGGLSITPTGGWRADSWVLRLTPEEGKEVSQQTAELILYTARARTYLASRKGNEVDRKIALDWSVDWLDRAERLDPQPPVALYSERARYLTALGEASRAVRDRQEAATRSAVTSRDFALLGTSLLSHDDLPGAEAALSKAVSIDPRAFWAWFALGHCRFDQGRYLDAAGDFNACVVLEPKFAWPHMNRGLALASAGRLAEAVSEYDRALEISPRFAEAWLNHALVDLELDDLDSAEKSITRAIALGINESGVFVILAEIKARQGRPEEAESLFSRSLESHPNDPVVLTARGFFRMKDDPVRATEDFDSALKANPRYARARYGLALLVRKNSLKDALAHVDAALAADPNLIDALQLRALLRARRGDLAAIDDAERLILVPTTQRLYNASCTLAILVATAQESRLASRSLDLLDRALDAGFPLQVAAEDPDLAPIRALPGYAKVFNKHRKTVPAGD